MHSDTWYRIATGEGPRYALERDGALLLIDGSPFAEWRLNGTRADLATARLLPPVMPGTFYAIGSNYRDHIEKMAAAANRAPIYYDRPRVGYRANSALIGHGDAIVKPADAGDEFQYEAELVVVMGKTIRKVDKEQAMDAVFGYTIGNDVSERAWQRKDPTNIRAKNCDTFKPMGPCISTLRDLGAMRTLVSLNGRRIHDFATANMIFSPGEVIAEISRYNTLSPGDVIWLGTDDRPENLKPGDNLEIELSGIGVLRNHIVAE